MEKEVFLFSKIEEKKDEYFLEYSPPNYNDSFSTLMIVFVEDFTLSEMSQIMEKEGLEWFKRFPIPIMISAYNKDDDLVDFIEGNIHDCNFLFCMQNQASYKIELYWRNFNNDEFPTEILDQNHLKKIYGNDVIIKKLSEHQSEVNMKYKKRKKYIVFFLLWLSVIPIAWVIFEFFSPTWISYFIFAYSIFKAVINAFKIWGKWNKSDKEIEAENEKRLMEHHHYYCKKNPLGFNIIKSEVIRKEQQAEIKKKYENMKY